MWVAAILKVSICKLRGTELSWLLPSPLPLCTQRTPNGNAQRAAGREETICKAAAFLLPDEAGLGMQEGFRVRS